MAGPRSARTCCANVSAAGEPPPPPLPPPLPAVLTVAAAPAGWRTAASRRSACSTFSPGSSRSTTLQGRSGTADGGLGLARLGGHLPASKHTGWQPLAEKGQHGQPNSMHTMSSDTFTGTSTKLACACAPESLQRSCLAPRPPPPPPRRRLWRGPAHPAHAPATPHPPPHWPASRPMHLVIGQGADSITVSCGPWWPSGLCCMQYLVHF